MTRFCTLAITLSMSAVLSYAENWNGKLLDASCYDTNASGSAGQTASKKSRETLAKTCAPTASTLNFALLDSKGKVYKFDGDGNAKAATAFKAGSLKGDKDGDVHVSISGSPQGDTLKVDSIQGHGEHK